LVIASSRSCQEFNPPLLKVLIKSDNECYFGNEMMPTGNLSLIYFLFHNILPRFQFYKFCNY
jgi:hypothetical protein